MKLYRIKFILITILASAIFVQCDDDENGNVIEVQTWRKGKQVN